jgi:DNA-binding PucR family transcriptional regulator
MRYPLWPRVNDAGESQNPRKPSDSVLPMSLEPALRNLARSPDLDPFRTLIEPLRAYDRERRNSDLILTLMVFFSSNANASETADKLFLHRNSVLYRLVRIQELTGLDLKDARDRLALQLGLLTIEDRGRSPNGEDEYP